MLQLFFTMEHPRLKTEILSKIKFPCERTFGDRFAAAFNEEFPFAEEIHAIDNMQCLTNVVVCDEDAHTALPEVLDDFLDVRNGQWVNPRKRFIEQNELRFECKTAGNLDATTLSARQLCTAAVAHMSDVELL